MCESACKFEYPEISPAKNLEDVWANFDPTLAVDPSGDFYVKRSERALRQLISQLRRSRQPVHAFLCGHRGSGKTTELHRFCNFPDIKEKFYPLYLAAQDFGGDAVHLTPDAIFVEIGRALTENSHVDPAFREELEKWGQQIVKTFLKNEAAQAEAGIKANLWAFFKAQLSTRHEWKYEQKQILEPKIQDLVDILNRMAQDFKNRIGKQVLVIVDDLEKGDSDADKAMHTRLFEENFTLLNQPRFSIIYTLPVYFRSLAGKRFSESHQIYPFSASRIYAADRKTSEKPPLDKESDGYQLMRDFVQKRLDLSAALFADENLLDELILIGGGLFRETARAMREAADFALDRNSEKIEAEDVKNVFNQIKKDYQPMIRGDAIRLLLEVDKSTSGWVAGVEPFLQSRAVVEYENGDLWLDLRYVLKPYVRGLE